MEYMHVKVHGGGNELDALEEFATALVAIADRDGDKIKALGVKPACLRGVAYGLLCHEKIEELCAMNKYFGDDKELRIAKKLVAMVARTERIYKEDGLRGLIADFAGGVDVEKVEVKDGKVTING